MGQSNDLGPFIPNITQEYYYVQDNPAILNLQEFNSFENYEQQEFEIEGLISLEDLHEKTGVEIPEGPYETLSGFAMHELGRIPKINDEILIPGARLKVLSMEGKRVGTLLLKRI